MTAIAERLKVATGGDPAGAVGAALDELRHGPAGVYDVAIRHDTGCPCLADPRPLTSCTCEIVEVERRRVR
jgi:hypothetical protein